MGKASASRRIRVAVAMADVPRLSRCCYDDGTRPPAHGKCRGFWSSVIPCTCRCHHPEQAAPEAEADGDS